MSCLHDACQLAQIWALVRPKFHWMQIAVTINNNPLRVPAVAICIDLDLNSHALSFPVLYRTNGWEKTQGNFPSGMMECMIKNRRICSHQMVDGKSE